jgi:hypothetical protein
MKLKIKQIEKGSEVATIKAATIKAFAIEVITSKAVTTKDVAIKAVSACIKCKYVYALQV